MRYYKISEETLRKLLQAQNELYALEIFGVDNWQGYGEHRENYLNEVIEELGDDISCFEDIAESYLLLCEIIKEAK